MVSRPPWSRLPARSDFPQLSMTWSLLTWSRGPPPPRHRPLSHRIHPAIQTYSHPGPSPQTPNWSHVPPRTLLGPCSPPSRGCCSLPGPTSSPDTKPRWLPDLHSLTHHWSDPALVLPRSLPGSVAFPGTGSLPILDPTPARILASAPHLRRPRSPSLLQAPTLSHGPAFPLPQTMRDSPPRAPRTVPAPSRHQHATWSTRHPSHPAFQ